MNQYCENRACAGDKRAQQAVLDKNCADNSRHGADKKSQKQGFHVSHRFSLAEIPL